MKRNKETLPQPEAVPTNLICSVCSLSWDLHVLDDNDKCDVYECIRLLKARQCRTTQHLWCYDHFSPNKLGGGFTYTTSPGVIMSTDVTTTTSSGPLPLSVGGKALTSTNITL